MQVEGSVAVVTGGASGLGLGAVRMIVEAGGRAAILDLPTTRGQDIAAEIGPEALFVATDVTQPDEVEHAVAHAHEVFGRIDVNVNAAGVAPAHRMVGKDGSIFPLDLFKLVVDINLVGLFDVARRCAAYMARNEPGASGERGLIVNVASVAAWEGQIGQAAYAASKGGVVSLALPLARDMASLGIRVMTIAPGIMDTPLLSMASDDLRERLLAVHVFPKRFGTTDDFAGLLRHIMENTFLNGEVIRLDAAGRVPPR